MKKLFIPLFLILSVHVAAQKDSVKLDSTKNVFIIPPENITNKAFPFLNIIPPSPAASVLGKYAEVPVSLASGTFSYDIPLYEITSGTLKLPVSISYHSAGLKTIDISGPVGTGWALQAGGVITRVMRGMPDEHQYGFLNTEIPNTSDPANEDLKCFLGKMNITQTADGEPDIFHYNFNGKSGKFLFANRTGSNQSISSPVIISQPQSNLKIVPDANYEKFTITDDDGTLYEFAATEQTNPISDKDLGHPYGTSYKSAWYLTKIVSANRIDTINLEYINTGNIVSQKNRKVTLVTQLSQNTLNYSYLENVTWSEYNNQILSGIEYKNGKMLLEYTQDRADRPAGEGYRLNKLKIFAKSSGGTLVHLKSYELSQSYFQCSDGPSLVDLNPSGPVSHSSSSFLRKRLKLEGIKEWNKSQSTSRNIYDFTYFENQQLPIYGAMAQDYWGLYNGASANWRNLLVGDIDTTINPAQVTLTKGADRYPNFSFAVVGSLKEIRNPLAGKTTFTYELNTTAQGKHGGGLRIKSIDFDPIKGLKTRKRYEYPEYYFTNNLYNGNFEDLIFGSVSTVEKFNNCVQELITETRYPEMVPYSVGTNGSSSLAYSKVVEYQETTSGNNNGKREYYYNTEIDTTPGDFPFVEVTHEWKRGQLLNDIIYKRTGTQYIPVKKTTTTYTTLVNPYYTRFYGGRITYSPGTGCGNYGIVCNNPSISTQHQFGFTVLNTSSSISLPASKTDYTYDETGSNPVVVYNTYTYDTKLNLKSEITYNSDSTKIEKRFSHPVDYPAIPVYQTMVSRNILTPVIEEKILENDTELTAKITNYKHWKTGQSYGDVMGFVAPVSVESRFGSSEPWTTEVMMGEAINNPLTDGYDLRARPIAFTGQNQVTTQVSYFEATGKKDLVQSITKNDQTETFNYLEGIGLNEKTAINGLKTYFEYDDYNRLALVKDHEQHILERISYSFADRVGLIPTVFGNLSLNISTDYNAILHSKFRIATTDSSVSADPEKALTQIQYFDGLGREVQQIGLAQSPALYDVILKHTDYDSLGRDFRNFIATPTVSSDGSLKTGLLSLAQSFYVDAAPNDSTIFENSPLNRPKVAFGPGYAWRTADKKTQVFYESAGTDVRYYKVNAANSVILDGVYPANSLYKKRTIDEQGHTTIEITDKLGRLVQKQVQKDGAGGYMTTYYCYDGLGRVRAILPPLAYDLNQSINATDANHNELIFAFEYDNRGRLIREDIPGAGERYSVYDKADRIVMQQDAVQRETGKWNFTKYDAFDREVMKGETGTIGQTQSYWASLFSSHSTPNEVWGSGGYSGTSFPSQVNAGAAEVRQYTFYDNYDFVNILYTNSYFGVTSGTYDFLPFIPSTSYYQNQKGNITGTLSYDLSNQAIWYVGVNYRDTKNRIIQNYQSHIAADKNTPNRTDFEYCFAGEVLKEKVVLKKQNEASKTLVKTNTFDHAGRKTSFSLSINGQNEKIANYSYDEIGRLKTKHLYPDRLYAQADSILDYINRPPSPGSNTIDIAAKAIILHPGTLIDSTFNYLAHIDTLAFVGSTVNGIQKIDFGYHIRGLQNCINCQSNVPQINTLENDFFASKLEWETAGRYDANIGKQTWENKKDKATKSYVYGYDPSSRMTVANYSGNGNEDYGISNLSYDANGNILNLVRKGFKGSNFGNIDQLSYTYTGNHLQKIDDAVTSNLNTKDFRDSVATTDYTYWSNGNLKSDLNKKISNIEYNTYLNKPKKITLFNGKELNFNYDGGGALISRFITDSTKWVYTPSEIYKDDSLYQISQDEGRITRKSGKYKLEFEYRDLWGNLRTAFTDSDSLPVSGVFRAPIISQINDYDPLGFEHFNNQDGTNNKLFQKQERIFDLDLGVDFFKYRVSDPSIGRFWSPDPLSSQFPHNSVYAFQENKLGLGIELEGAELISFPLSSTSAIARPFTIPNTSALRVPILPNGTTLAPMSSTQDHHLNPQQHKNHEIVKEARKEGFKQDGKENKIPLEKYNKETGDGQHGNHPKYNEYTKKELDNFAEKNPTRQPQESLEFVRNMVKDLKAKISENPKAKINDLFNSNFPVVSPDNTKTNSKPNPLNVNPCLNNPNCL